MADYNPILDPEIAPDSPAPSILFHRLRDNPIAIAEGAEGAPKVSQRAQTSDFLGILSFTLTPSGLSDVGWVEEIRFTLVIGASGGGPRPQISFSNDNGASWGGWQDISSTSILTNHPNGFYFGVVNLRTGKMACLSKAVVSTDAASMSAREVILSVPDNTDAVRFRLSAGSGPAIVMVHANGGR